MSTWLADVNSLSYTKQCAVVDKLQQFVAELGLDDAATLLVVSGKRRQVILNSLSQQAVDLPPLPPQHLRCANSRSQPPRPPLCCDLLATASRHAGHSIQTARGVRRIALLTPAVCRLAMVEAFASHCGDTRAVCGEVNGAGKSTRIMADVAELQAAAAAGTSGREVLYRRLPFREASTASSMVAVLSRFVSGGGADGGGDGLENVVHLDVGHIIPAAANTVLFELLVVGVIRDMASCRVYARRKQVRFRAG